MVNISKSGEEGYYSDLQKTTEERLRSLSPNNRHLCSEELVLTRNNMNSDDWNKIVSDVSNWKKEIHDLRLTEENNNSTDEIALPPIRQPPSSKCTPEKKPTETTSRMRHTAIDFNGWDQCNKEQVKMDLEQEREKDKDERQHEQREGAEIDRLELYTKKTEKRFEMNIKYAEQENEQGNICYGQKEFTEAIKHYTASIAIWPIAKAYNNRAACYLKQGKYSAALQDVNSTLQLEPDNVKALFRRGIALQHKNMFREALADMNAVLEQQPKHFVAQYITNELREQVFALPKTVRIMTDEGYNKPKKIVEMQVKPFAKDFLPPNSYEVNELGLPKVMCQCTGTPRFLQLGLRKYSTYSSAHSRPLAVAKNSRLFEIANEAETSKAFTKLEVFESEKIGSIQKFYKPKKCVVADKRTQRNTSTCTAASTSFANGDYKTNLTKRETNTNSTNTNSANRQSEMDEDFELNTPLLAEASGPINKPTV